MRVSATGRHRVDRDAVAGQLEGGDDGEGRDAGLGRAVVGLAGVAVDARHRRGVDDAAVHLLAGLDLLPPVGGGPAGRAEGALEVDLDDGVPLLLGHVGQHPVPQDAGVVDHDVEVAEALDGGVDEALRALPGRDVVAVGHRPRRPWPSISSTTCWAGLRSPPLPSTLPPRSLTTTLAPWPARLSACSRPMPRPAPVTMATRPSQRPMLDVPPVETDRHRIMPGAPRAVHMRRRRAAGRSA